MKRTPRREKTLVREFFYPEIPRFGCSFSPSFFFFEKKCPRGLFFLGIELFLVFFSSLNTFFLIAEHPHASVSGAASLSFLIHIIYI